jgi:outer membrane protein
MIREIKSIHALVLGMIFCLLTGTAHTEEKTYTIQDAYQSAIANNEFMKIAEEDRAQSDYRVDQAWTYLYPRVVAQGSFTKYDKTLPPSGGPFLFQPEEQLRAALVLTQPLYTGGRTLAALRTAQKMQVTSATGVSLAKQDLMMNVSEAYYAVLKAQKSVEISTRSLERMERHRQITEREAKTRKSKANQSALLRANSLVTQARIALVRSQDGLKIAKDKLSLLSKLPQDVQLAEPQILEVSKESMASIQKKALESRDDYANSKVNRSIAEENVTIVKGGHYPQFYAEAGVQYSDSRPEMATDSTVYYAGLRLQIPIFEGGLMKAEVSEAKSKVRQAELSGEFLRKSIESDVQESYVNLQTVTSVLDTAKIQMEYAKGNFDAVESLYSEGLLTSLSMIDAEGALTSAERELMNATYDREVAIIRLKKSMGMLGKDST